MPLTYDEASEVGRARREMREKGRVGCDAIMHLAGFTVSHVWELANGYWPDHATYDDVRQPWWLYMTEIGPIQIGRRKNVINISWAATDVRVEVTADDVTKSDTHVHAWSTPKAIEYLTALRAHASPRTSHTEVK